MKLILIGLQGSGKSTQGNILSEEFGIPYLSSGHIFREIAKGKSKFSRYTKEVLNAGYLIPDNIAFEVVKKYLKRKPYQKGFILDGFPRTLQQAKEFEQKIDWVINFNIAEKTALERLGLRVEKESREDDTNTAIKKRIDLFYRFTKPVINYYKKKGIVIEVDGEKSVDEIKKTLFDTIRKKNDRK